MKVNRVSFVVSRINVLRFVVRGFLSAHSQQQIYSSSVIAFISEFLWKKFRGCVRRFCIAVLNIYAMSVRYSQCLRVNTTVIITSSALRVVPKTAG